MTFRGSYCVQAHTELTYDYRFAGEEKLHCNCGAANCRGMVNEPERVQGPPRLGADGSMLVERSKLKPYVRKV